MCLVLIKTFQQIKYSINCPQGPQHTSIIIYFCYKEYQSIQRYHNLYIVLADKIVNLEKNRTVYHIATANDSFF